MERFNWSSIDLSKAPPSPTTTSPLKQQELKTLQITLVIHLFLHCQISIGPISNRTKTLIGWRKALSPPLADYYSKLRIDKNKNHPEQMPAPSYKMVSIWWRLKVPMQTIMQDISSKSNSRNRKRMFQPVTREKQKLKLTNHLTRVRSWMIAQMGYINRV